MSKRDTGTQDKQNKPQRTVNTEAIHHHQGEFAPGLPAGGLLGAAGAGTPAGDAARLADRRFPAAQRQMLAARIGRVNGNQVLRRVINSQIPHVQRDDDEETQSSADSGAQWDSSGPTSSHSPQLGADGNISYGYSRGRQTTVGIDDETYMRDSSATSGGVSFNPNDGRVGANLGYTRTNEIGDQSTSSGATASGYLDFNREGELEGGGGSVGVSSNGTSVSIGGGIVVTAERPRRDTSGRFVVTWRRQYTGTVSGSRSGSDRGASASYQGQQTITGSRTFDTQEAAQTFYDSRRWTEIDPADAGQLQSGDQISQSDSNQVTVGGNGQIYGITVGANITVGGGHSVEVTGLGNQRISVKVVDSFVLGGAVSVGAPGVSLTGGAQSTDSHGYIVTFDLSSAAGRRAFQYLQDMGQLPPGRQGYTMQAVIEGEEWQESSGFSVGGVTATNTNTVAETTTRYQSGRTVEERQGTEATSIAVPFLGDYSESDQLTATDDSNAANRTYTVRSTVSGTSTQDVNQGLADATGVGFNQVRSERDDQHQRRWTVTSTFTHQQVERLVAQIRSGNWNHNALIYESGHGADFAAEVRDAGDDWDRIDRALTEFVSETGDNGLALIRSTIGSTPRYNLTLQGDAFMTGAAGHSALATKMQRWRRQLQSSGTARAVAGEINRELASQRERLTAISDPERYPDLPSEIRRREISRTRSEVTELESLQSQARSQAQQEVVPEEQAASEPAQEAEANMSQMSPAQLVAVEWEQVNTAEGRVTEKREQCIETGNEARRAHWIHYGAYAYSHSAFETWGERHWYGDDDHAGQYEQAQRYMNAANNLWNSAQQSWQAYQREKTDLEIMSPNEAAGQVESTLTSRLQRTYNHYSNARGNFRRALDIYNRIRAAHPEGRNNQFQGYTGEHELPEERRLE